MADVFKRRRRHGSDPRPERGAGLDTCPICRGDFVHPREYVELDAERWHMLLRCAQCGSMREVIVGDEVAQAFARVLDEQTETIAAALQRLDRERMTAQAATFVAALELDLIDAADFAG